VTVVVDFAHSPDSLAQMIEFLKAHYPHMITVFGCGGESDPHKRPLMGRISGRRSDHTILTHDNPKHEDPDVILAQIEAGIRTVTRRYEVIPDRKRAIGRALSLAERGDCVLVAGKGHETTQTFGDRVVDFNDRQFLIEACGARPRSVVQRAAR
jgi:UDP-N-acetylmuramoyl-L-alanyl-D-glutamate--2,6-diaminopimelate ligase